MDTSRWGETRALFDELVELAPDRRAERLAAIGDTDPRLRDTLESLLAADARSSGLIGVPGLSPNDLDAAAQAPDPLGLSDRTISHFRILEPLGAGGMGVVYRAEDTHLGRVVALKLPLPQYGLDPSARARFLQEARSAAALDHPNLCTIYEVGQSDEGRVFIAMAFYQGETLKERLLREGPLPIVEAVEIARQTAEGLTCAHAAGIVHRDLKPANLMRLPDGAVKVLDFGLAKMRDLTLTASDSTLGTVAYMAPEQVRGERVDGRTDLWALGVVLYELLTGQKPFGGELEQAMAHAIVYQDPAPPSGLRPEVPGALEATVMRLLSKEPGKRYATAEELLLALAPLDSAMTRPRRRFRNPTTTRRHGIRQARALSYLVGASMIGTLAWTTFVLGRGLWEGEAIDPNLVAIAPFTNRTGDATLDPLGPMAADWIARGLVENSVAPVADFPFDAQSLNDQVSLKAQAEAARAGVVVTGSYYLEGEDVLVVARVADVRSGEVLWEIPPLRARRGEPRLAMENLRSLVAGAVAVHLDPMSPVQAILGGAPPRYEAYRAYLDTREAFARGDWAAAKTAAHRALALDSTFFQVTAELAWYHLNVGECASIDSIQRELETRRERVADYYRLAVAQPAAMCRNDLEGSYRVAERALEIAPGSSLARLGLAIAARLTGRLREAADEYQRMDLMRGPVAAYPAAYQQLVDVLHLLGRYEEELQVGEQARRQHPDFEWRYHMGIDALAALERASEVEARINELRRGRGPSNWTVVDAYLDMADELAWHGHTATARRFAARALEHATHLTGFGSQRAQRAWALMHLERWPEMRLVLDSIPLVAGEWSLNDGATYEVNHGSVLAMKGIAAAKTGDRVGARAALSAIALLSDGNPPVNLRGREVYLAMVLAALGEKEEALRQLQQGQARGVLPQSAPGITHDNPLFRDLWHDSRFEALFAAR